MNAIIQEAINELRERIAARQSELLELQSAVSVLESLEPQEKVRLKKPAKRPKKAPVVDAWLPEKSKYQKALDEGPENGEHEPPETPRAEPTDKDNRKTTATSKEGISLGNTLGQPFTVTDLRARLDGDQKRSYNWVALWKGRGWIETCGFGSYRRTEKFGI
jgi:hypothetical protein